MTQLLTYSRQDTFKTCRRKHFYAYELGIRPLENAKALRMGSAHHDGLEVLANSDSLDAAIELVRRRYARLPEGFDKYDWEIECETVLRLLCGYVWKWGDSKLTHLAAEQRFNLPLRNPATGGQTPNFELAGKIDGIVRLEDGRLAVKESKLLSEELDSDSPLWRRLRIDHQISMYVFAARQIGFDVDAVLYDVTRKPAIKPTAVPVVDELGAKIVLDKYGQRVKTDKGTWRQTGDSNRGYFLQTRNMTVDEWGEKLASDIGERPEFYFARNEIARLDQDIEEYARELWDIQRTIRDAQLNNRHYRTCNKDTCSWCPYFGPCSSNFDPNGVLPDGFVRVNNLHPELAMGEQTNVDNRTEGSAA